MTKAIALLIRSTLLLCLAFAGIAAQAADWPGNRPVRLIVASLPGSSPDLTARYLADQLAKMTGGSFVVVNKAGGLGIPALTEVVQASADGTTLLIGNINTNGLAPALHAKKYSFDPKTALRPITMISDGPSALVAAKSAPANLKAAMAAWKATPGKYAYFAAGPGSFGHVWFAKLVTQEKLDLLFVPVKGGMEGLQLLHEGSVHYAYVPIASFINQMRNKDVQTVFVTTPARLPEFPDAPTLREAGLSADFQLNTWVGLFGQSKMAPELVNQIHQAFTKAVKLPEIGTQYSKAYMVQSTSSSPEEFEKFINGQIDQFRQLGERANIKVQD